MKILVVCQYYYPENFTISNICEELVKLGHNVDVLTGKPNYGFDHILKEYKNVKNELINGVNVHRVKISPRNKSKISTIKNYLSFWRNSKKWVRRCKTKYDVVYSMSLSPVTILSAGSLYKKKFGTRFVVHCVDLWPESVSITGAIKKNSLVFKILYKWSKKLYENADEILIGSPSFKNYFNDVLHINNVPIKFVPQCSLVENFLECECPIKLPTGTNIFYCGNIGTIQLVENIPEAMSLVKNNVHFHVIGMGVNTQKFLENIKKFNVEDRVIYHGPKPFKEAIKYLVNADALFVSLKAEGYVGNTIPNKLTMYLSFGKPIIGSLTGDGLKIANETRGVVVCKQDASSIACAIDKLCSIENSQLNVMGKRNLAYYSNNFSCKYITKEIEQILFENIK